MRLLLAIGLVGLPGIFAAAAASSAPGKPKPVDTTVRISSVPEGAFVRFNAGAEFNEVFAVPLGKAPLIRL